MALFRRNRRSEETDAVAAADGEPITESADTETPNTDPVSSRPGEVAEPSAGGSGPLDRSQVAGLQDRIDLGALWLTPVEGMQLRLEIDQESNEVTSVSAVVGESVIQIQAFAAPRSSGIWDEIRAEIAESVASQGGTVAEQPGPWGTELHARLPGRTPDGRVTYHPARFVGVDGPRWFLRAVVTGPAAADETAAEPLLAVVRSCVVLRGEEAMAPRELLPLQLPMEEPLDGDETPPPPPDADDFSPFERGPEITEIR